MSDHAVINYPKEIPAIYQMLGETHGTLDKMDFDRKLSHLVLLRASQLNQCGYCVKMHTREAREDGETNERLDHVIVWPHTDDFTDREKAAFKWTEALTHLENNTDYSTLRAELRMHFSEQEISILTATIVMINLWNRLHVANH